VSGDDELAALREEVESLAAFLHMLQREYTQLHHDFAAAIRAAGGTITLAKPGIPESATAAIERVDDPTTGAATFRVRE
jgi:hypothetical protein